MRLLTVTFALGLAGQAAGQPASSPPPPVMIFFDWGKPDVRSDDQAVLDQVAEAHRARSAAHLRLAGHTDRSGSAAANRAAGLKRAQMVRTELEKRGIPRNAMSIASFGEDQPLVPTEDGVREVQNRRVVIAFEE
jgi:outer membrane protein OmpA-like peptidoglycan-associated protein